MKLGIIVRSDASGLGYQTRDYYKFLNPAKVMLVDISKFNGMKQNYWWYKNPQIVQGIPNEMDIRTFLDGLDVVLTAETPYTYKLYQIAREKGVKTVCVPNYEFFDYYINPGYAKPDLMILPSRWHEQELIEWGKSNKVQVKYIHHPVDTDEIKFRERTTTKTFHLAGKPAVEDRNGTWSYLIAQPEGLVTTQSEKLSKLIKMRYPQARILMNLESDQLYQYGDIMVLPRKYGGNCLPLSEALASGCPVIMPDIEPNNCLLPKEWLVKAEINGFFTPRTKIDLYEVSTQDLIEKIEWFRKQNMKEQSQKAREIAESISWNALKYKWEDALCELLQ